MSNKPNILILMADQHRGDAFGFEGKSIQTPHLDLMSKSGTRFKTCITPNVLCQPARTSFITGLLPCTTGVSDNGIDLNPELGNKSFAGALSKSGYHTALIGKAHFSTSHTFDPTGTPECRSSMHSFDENWNGPYMGFEYVQLVVEGHNAHLPLPPPNGQHYEKFYYQDGLGDLKNKLYKQNGGPSVKDAPQTWHSKLPLAWHNSTWITDKTISHLDEIDLQAPFCIMTSFPDPHHPFDCPMPWSLLHDPNYVDLPKHRSLDLDKRPWWHRASLEGKPDIRSDYAEFRNNFSRISTINDEQLRQVIANYYGMISLIDHCVGRIVSKLIEKKIVNNTIIIYTSDHGEWLGDHGLLLKGPMLYDGLLRVGCIFQGPNIPHGKIVSSPISTLDIASTILDYCNTKSLIGMHSSSLRNLIEEDKYSRDYAYNEWDLRSSRSGIDLELRTVRTSRYRLTIDLISGAGEIYDFKNDPYELENIFDVPSYKKLKRELIEKINERPNDALFKKLDQVGMA